MNHGLARSRSDRPIVVVDLGGTWVRVSGLRDPRAAPTGDGRRGWRACPRCSIGCGDAGGSTRRDLAALGVASRGIWTAGERRALARRLRRFAPRVLVISDVEAAYLAALGASPGVLLLAGTGSIALGRDRRGRFARAGGLGPLLGDDGSAFAIGRAWLRADAIPPARARRHRHRARRGRARRRARARRCCAARAAATGRARRIVRGRPAGARRAGRARDAARDGRAAPIAVSWAGGLLDDPRFRAGVWRALRRRGLRIRPVRSGAPPPRRPRPGARVCDQRSTGSGRSRRAGRRRQSQ